jgi:flagellar motor protein MotB
MDVPDIYTTAKSNLRDNVKTLITVFGGVAGVLIAGTPFSGFGKLDFGSTRFYVASICLVLAAGLIGFGLRRLLKVMQPDLVYPTALSTTFDISKVSSDVRHELKGLNEEFKASKGELLPEGVESIEDLQAKLRASWDACHAIEICSDDEHAKDRKADAREAYDELAAVELKINHWAAFTRMCFRVKKGVDHALILGMVSLVCIGIFSWAVGSSKDKLASTQIVLLADLKSSNNPVFPVIPSIFFETDKSNLSEDAIQIIGEARNYLRSNTNTGVLVYAYTDTKGDMQLNRRLAKKRASSVTQALIEEGGISNSRVFVAELPETNLPILTAQETGNNSNRAVNLVLVPISASR